MDEAHARENATGTREGWAGLHIVWMYFLAINKSQAALESLLG
jgi:hypothetical protein